ncbi:MAG: hypothetical protein LBP88_01755, partial [Treponema sp.]|nr:hypothetical protein [Treponema sp.]
VDNAGQVVDNAGQVVDNAGQVVDNAGQVVDNAAQVVDNAGQIVDDSIGSGKAGRKGRICLIQQEKEKMVPGWLRLEWVPNLTGI